METPNAGTLNPSDPPSASSRAFPCHDSETLISLSITTPNEKSAIKFWKEGTATSQLKPPFTLLTSNTVAANEARGVRNPGYDASSKLPSIPKVSYPERGFPKFKRANP